MTRIATLIRIAKKQIRKMVIQYKLATNMYRGFEYLKMTEKLLKGDY